MELVSERSKLKTGMPTEGLFILVGNPKSGKTTFAASFPNSYVLELEKGGADRVAGRIHDIESLEQFREAIAAVVAEPGIKTIVIDTVDALSDWMEDEVAKSKGLETINERKKGVDGFEVWGEYRSRMERFVTYLKATGKLVILLAHCREAKTDEGGNIVTPMGINVPGKSGGYLAANADIIGYTFRRHVGGSSQYVVTFQGGPLGYWGSRIDEINDKTITLPRANPYAAFEALFAGKEKAAVAAGA